MESIQPKAVVSTRLGTLLFLLFGSLAATAQAPVTPAREFEATSVKRNLSGSTRSSVQVPPAGTITYTNVTLRLPIRDAYGLAWDRFTLVSGPFAKIVDGAPGMRREDVLRFDVQGKPPEHSQPRDRRAMLRALLEDRFKLRVHKEMRQMPVYALTVARPGRLGPNLKPSKFDCDAYIARRQADSTAAEPVDSAGKSWCQVAGARTTRPIQIRTAGPMSRLAGQLGGHLTDRPVVDATGLAGNFEWVVTYNLPGDPEPVHAGIFTAFQEQLGLKIEEGQAPLEVLVIDAVELPTEN